MDWQKINLPGMVRYLKLKRFRAAAREHIIEFVALSVEFDPPGIVDSYDDEIAGVLDTGPQQWLNLRDAMLMRDIIRWIPGPGGKRIYEISLNVLPDQSSPDRDGKPGVRDGRRKEAWTETTDLPPLSMSEGGNASVKPKKSAMTGAERKAKYDAARRALKNSEPFDEDAFLEQYRAAKNGENAGPVTNSGDGNEAQNVTDSVTENGNGNEPENREQKEHIEERDNNNTAEGNGNGNEIGNDSVVVFSLPDEKEAAVTFLSVTGVTVNKGRDNEELVVISRSKAEELADLVFRHDGNFDRIYDQAKRLPWRKADKAWAGMLITAIEGNYKGPGDYDRYLAEQAKRDQEEARRRAEGAAREQAAVIEAEKRRADELYATMLELNLSADERERVEARALQGLSKLHRDRIRDRLTKLAADGAQPASCNNLGEMLQPVWDAEWRRALLEFDGQRAAAAGPPS